MADPTPSGGAAAAGPASEPMLLKLFPTPVLIATLPDAEALNAELKRIILEREKTRQSAERSDRGWQSGWDLQQWGGAALQPLVDFARAIAADATVDRVGKHPELGWRVSCRANVHRRGGGSQFHVHPGAMWSANYYVDDGGVADDPSLGGELELADPRGVAPTMYAPRLTFPGPDGLSLGESQRLTPRSGAMVVIPSWLFHGVCPYRGHGERVSIALNFSVAGI